MSDTLPAFRLDEMPTPEYATEIIFEGTRCVVIAPEDYAAMYARIAELETELAYEKESFAYINTMLQAGRDVMAVIHGDGGHYREAHGDRKAADDAINIIYKLRADLAIEREHRETAEKMLCMDHSIEDIIAYSARYKD